MKHVKTAYTKSWTSNRLVTLLLFRVAFTDRKWAWGVVLQPTITVNTETIAFSEETFGKFFHKAAIVKSNGNVRPGQSRQQRSLKMLWKTRKYYSQKLFSLDTENRPKLGKNEVKNVRGNNRLVNNMKKVPEISIRSKIDAACRRAKSFEPELFG
jgi:hypothetical protein